MVTTYTSIGEVKQFPPPNGWIYLPIEQNHTELTGGRSTSWGMVPATITIGATTWKKSLLPYGDGTLFIALNKKVREAEGINVGDIVTATFRV